MKKAMKILLVLLCAVALVVGSVLGTLAYLTSTDTNTNTFTAGNVDTELDEENTDKDPDDPDDPERDKENEYHLTPGESYTKDPTVHIKGGSDDLYLFVTVENDISDLEPADDTEVKDPKDPTKNITYVTVKQQMLNNGWVLLLDNDGNEVKTSEGLNVWVFAGDDDGVNKNVVVTEPNIINKVSVETDVVVFEYFAVDKDKDNADLAAHANYTYFLDTDTTQDNPTGDTQVTDVTAIANKQYDYKIATYDEVIEIKSYAIQATGFEDAYAAFMAEWSGLVTTTNS